VTVLAVRPRAAVDDSPPRQGGRHDVRWAFQLPCCEPPNTYVPDIVLPDTVPVYVTAAAPTVPKVIALPVTVPVRGSVPEVDRLIVPLSFPDDSVHVSAKVPVKAPVYEPDHLPLSAPAGVAAGDVALGVDAGVVATVGVAAALVDDAAGADEVGVPDPLLHPDARTAGSSSAAASRVRRAPVRMTVVMGLPFGLARRRSPPSIRSTGAVGYWRLEETKPLPRRPPRAS
jgi:hypothetical protein